MSEESARFSLRRPGSSLRRRLVLSNGVVALLMLVAVGVVALQIGRLITAVNSLQDSRRYLDAAITVRHQSTELYATVTRMLLEQDGAQFSEAVSQELYDLTEGQRHLREIIEDSQNPEFQTRLQAVDENVSAVINIATTMVRQAEAEQWHSVEIRAALLNRDQAQVLDAVNVLVFTTQQAEDAAFQQVLEAERAVIIYPSIIFVITVLIAILLFSRTVATVTGPVRRLTEGAARLAAGNLDARVEVESRDELGQLAEAFNTMAEDLRAYYGELEGRVAERTRALRTSLDVSRRLSTILNRSELTREVVDQVQEAFDYYHVHIYLFDEERRQLLMVGGTGEAGRVMLARGHRLQAGQGLVGRAAAANEVILVPDVSQESDWLPNPLLAHTQAEVAVPIAFGGEVQGVLDVQHDEVGGLDKDDVDLLQVIAAQVAVALQNARLLEESEARAERASMVNAINRRIQNATSVEAVLQIAAQELGRALSVERAQVELRTPSAAAGRTGSGSTRATAGADNGANGSSEYS